MSEVGSRMDPALHAPGQTGGPLGRSKKGRGMSVSRDKLTAAQDELKIEISVIRAARSEPEETIIRDATDRHLKSVMAVVD
jgi:hypothetical protein